MNKPLWDRFIAKGAYVPKEVATCPECGSEIIARAMEQELETGRPIATGIELDCLQDLRDAHADTATHRFSQSDWQPVRDKVVAWCDARVGYGP